MGHPWAWGCDEKGPECAVWGEVSECREQARRSAPCGGIAGGVCEQEAGGRGRVPEARQALRLCHPHSCPSCLLPLACWDRLQESLHSPCPSVPTRCAGGRGTMLRGRAQWVWILFGLPQATSKVRTVHGGSWWGSRGAMAPQGTAGGLRIWGQGGLAPAA